MTESEKEFKDVAKPLIEWLQANTHPHHKVVVTSEYAELLEGKEACIVFPDRDNDEQDS